jgi:hypothetical protein
MQYVLDLQSTDAPGNPGGRTISSLSLVACFSTWSVVIC